MKTLIVERNVEAILGLKVIKDAKVVRSIYDCIYLLLYTKYEPDSICIAADLEEKISNSDTDADRYLQSLNDYEFLPIGLGEICREICSEKKKKNPKVVLMGSKLPDVLEESVKAHKMEFVNFNDLHFAKKLLALLNTSVE